MSEKDQEFTNYMERISKFLSNYPEIEDNIKPIINYIDNTRHELVDLRIERKDIHENHLTYADVILLAREILEQIEPDYLEIFDHIIKDGTLDFDYNYANKEESYLCKYNDSHFSYEPQSKTKSINIIRDMNYNDVITLIHEFMHYANYQPIANNKRTLFTEFFSIYYELYATKYLLEKKGISPQEISVNDRIVTMYKRLKDISKYEYSYLSYLSFGKVDLEAFNQYYVPYKQEEYEFERDYSLDIFHRVEKMGDNLENHILSDFKYGLGSMLAYWAIDNVEKSQVLSFYKEIYNIENKDMTIKELFNKYGFHITKKFPEEIKASVEKFMALQEKNTKHL